MIVNMMKYKQSEPERTEAEEQEGSTYIIPDWSKIRPEFSDKQRILVDFDINFFTDRYGLSDNNFTTTETIKAFQTVADIWAQANIWTRFKIDEIRTPKRIEDKKADAYRWWLMSAKPIQQKMTPASTRDFNRYLVNGPGELGGTGAQMVLKKFYAHSGHDLFNWILGSGRDRIGDLGSPTRLYFVYYFPWYNGMGNENRICVRVGSCGGTPKLVEGIKVTCKSWGNRPWEERDFTIEEFVRILAHEIGHTFSLHHPKAACTAYAKEESMQLMHQQVAVTKKGTPCGPRNRFARFARHLPLDQLTQARRKAQIIMNAQSRKKTVQN